MEEQNATNLEIEERGVGGGVLGFRPVSVIHVLRGHYNAKEGTLILGRSKEEKGKKYPIVH